MMCSAMEVYLRSRFVELEKILTVNFEALSNEFFKKEYLELDRRKVRELAENNKTSEVKELVEGRYINFQELKKSRLAYSSCYGLNILDVSLNAGVLDTIRFAIKSRHKIIHSATDMTVLNREESPPANPIYSSKEFGLKCHAAFFEFLNQVHELTSKPKL